MKRILFILLFLSVKIYAQEVKVSLSSPYNTLYTHKYFLEEESYDSKKASRSVYGHLGERGEEIAIRINKVLVGKGLVIDFKKVPKDRNFKDTINDRLVSRFTPFPYRFPELSVVKRSGYWYFSQEIVDQIDDIYLKIYPKYSEKIQEFVPEWGHKSIFNIELWQFISLILLFSLCSVLFKIMTKLIFWCLKKVQFLITHKTSLKITEALKQLARPVSLVVVAYLVKAVIPVLMLDVEINNFLLLSLDIIITVFWVFVFMKLVTVLVSIYAYYAKRTESLLDDQLIPILGDFLHIIVILGGVLYIVTLFGVDPVTVMTGASLGGLAVALAAQDTVKNLIGTVMIFLDKPFHIGDWVEAGEVVGTVEVVGFRSTRVRAADTSIYQIPNSQLSEMVVNNKGLRAYRRYKTDIGVRYDTPPELIEAFVIGIRKIIDKHPNTREEHFNVEFSGFSDSAILIMVNLYFKSLEWSKEQSSKHDLHLAILKLAAQLGVEFAFPSTTVFIEDFPEKQHKAYNYNTDKARIEQVINDINKK